MEKSEWVRFSRVHTGLFVLDSVYIIKLFHDNARLILAIEISNCTVVDFAVGLEVE